MKRLIPLLLCLALLWGCGTPEGPDAAVTEPVPTEAPTEPAGLYDPDSELEALTCGALKVYPLNRADTQSIVPFGDALLLFNTLQTTALTRLSGDTLAPTAAVTLEFSISSEDPAVQVSEKGVTYYDDIHQELVFLDAGLKEVNRISMPETILGSPALSKDRKLLYYFTADSLRVLDLESGIDRLLKEMSFGYQLISALHCGDTVLECTVGDGDTDPRTLFLSVSTGALLWEQEEHLTLHTEGDRYFVTRMDGTFPEKLTGTADSQISMLHCPDHNAAAYPVLSMNGVVTVTDGEQTRTLDFYDLEYGMRPYSVALPDRYDPGHIAGDPEKGCVWLLCYDSVSGCDVLCRWDPEKSPVQDDTVYIGMRRTPENPDEYGLQVCTELAGQLSEKHGVRILIWNEAADYQPWDYSLEAEYHTPVIQDALDALDTALSHFPEGFLAEAASEMGDGTLHIALVRDILRTEGTIGPDSPGGIQFRSDEGNAYVCVEIGNAFEGLLYHELFHVIESRIFSLSSAFDNWNDLNPEDFQYDNGYGEYEFRDDTALISGDTQAFVDYYSMTYPKEDRARIMEYAMMPGNEAVFSSGIMQSKLRALCEGIREAYGLEDSTEAFLWEQYLTE